MGSGGPLGLQNRWSASLAMSTDGSFPSRPRPIFELKADNNEHTKYSYQVMTCCRTIRL
jgi:hypothetical protein